MEKIKELNDFLQKNKPIPKKITNKKLSKPITAKSKKSVARK